MKVLYTALKNGRDYNQCRAKNLINAWSETVNRSRAKQLLLSFLLLIVAQGMAWGQSTTLATYYFENNTNPEIGAIGSPSIATNSISLQNSNVCQGTYSIEADADGDYVELTIATTGYRNISIQWQGRRLSGGGPAGINQWLLTGDYGSGYGNTLNTQTLDQSCALATQSLSSDFNNKSSIKLRLTYDKDAEEGTPRIGRLDALVIKGIEICDATLATTPGSRCDEGTVQLSVTPSDCFTSSISWYADLTGGSSLGTGTTFTTPSISTTTTYYAQENLNAGVTTIGSTPIPESGKGLQFNLDEPIILKSVQISAAVPISGSTVIGLRDRSGNSVPGVLDVSFTPAVGAQIVNLNWEIPAGIDYKILKISGTSTLTRTQEAVWPIDFTIGSITGNVDTGAGNINRYNFFYNWSISRERIPVVATVNHSPTVTCPANITVNNDLGVCTSSQTFAAIATATVTGSPEPTLSYKIGGEEIIWPHLFPKGTTTVDVNATNICGTVSCSFTVTVEDNENPTAVCKAVTVQLDANGEGSISADDLNDGSSDNCGTANLQLSASQTNFTCADKGENIVVLTVTDESGNSSTCNATVTVADEIYPTACNHKVTLCHKTGNGECHEIEVDAAAVQAHLNHGDFIGTCTDDCTAPSTAKKTTIIVEESMPEVGVYPNPTNKMFTLELQGGKVEVSIYDVLGRFIRRIETLDTRLIVFGEDLPTGSYFAIITQGENKKTIRLLKN